MIPDFRTARADNSRAVLEGFHAIKHAIRFGATIESVVTRDAEALRALAMRLAPDVAPALMSQAVLLSGEAFDALTPVPVETGVLAIAQRRVLTLAQLEQLPRARPIILLESPSHPGNVGAVVRVAAGAGAAAVLTTGQHDPWSPAAIRGSAGLHFALPVGRVDVTELSGRRLIVIDPEGEPIEPANLPGDAVYAFGSERAGLSEELKARADEIVGIPMEPGVSSLNLATSVAIVLYAWRLARR